MSISPTGVLTRSIWNYYPRQIMGGFGLSAGVSGNYVAVYNNDKTGNYLWIIAATVGGTNNTDVVFENIPFNPNGTTVSSGNIGSFPVVTDAPLLSGQMQIFESPVCLGSHVGYASNVTAVPYQWPHDWPMAIVAPGSAFGFQCLAPFSAITVGLWWWVGPTP